MQTAICERLGNDVPVFAFSHCRDVVLAVAQAGGYGVLGSSTVAPEELEEALTWIDARIGDRRYGVDVLIPVTYDVEAEQSDRPLEELIPAAQRDFVNDFLSAEGVPELPVDFRNQWLQAFNARSRNNTQLGARRLLEVALRHPKVNFIVSALGAPPKDIVTHLHERGILVGALCGKAAHVSKHKEAGVDVVIAQGTEAGGHTGSIATMVLVPEVVEAAGGDLVVLAAGGISRGSQVAAAIALGAQGAWCGTVWLGTVESELGALEKDVIFSAAAEDAVRSKWRTGKPVRMVRSKLSEMWELPGAPAHLPPPLQGALYYEAALRAERAGRRELISVPAGQVVGSMKHETSVREVMRELMSGYGETMERLAALAAAAE